MQKIEIREKINNILVDKLKVDEQLTKKDTTSLVDDIALDSLQMLNFILLVEECFDICIDADEIENDKIAQLSYITDYVYKKLL